MSEGGAVTEAAGPVVVEFDDNHLLALLLGEHDEHLARIEQSLGIHAVPRGNRVAITGDLSAREATQRVLASLYARLKRGMPVGMAEVDAAVRMVIEEARTAEPPEAEARGGQATSYIEGEAVIRTKKRRISPRSLAQGAYLQSMREKDLVFGIGPAGTGKTYLAVAMAVSMFLDQKIDRIILSRPAVEAGERLGFLPGDLKEKVDPYLRPLYDALADTLPGEMVAKLMEAGKIEVAPLAFMRGRTLSNAFVILDEAQNTTAVQMKMFLTRLGENSRMVVTGDLSQIDLPNGVRSGLTDALDVLKGVDAVAVQHFTQRDVIRHPLVTRIVDAYAAHDKAVKAKGNPK